MACVLLTILKLLVKVSLVILSAYSTCQGCFVKHGPIFSTHHWVELRNNPYKTLTGKTSVRCGLICAKDPKCLSFNYFTGSTMCVFNDIENVDSNSQVVYNPSSVYYLRVYRVSYQI